ncbi:MAG: pilus assembly protein PilM, partial [Oscillospiraceae bacterium]
MTNRRKKHSIGLVLDAMELRAIELSGTPECFEVCAQGCVTLPQGLVVDGTITDLAAMEVILKQLFRDGDFSRAPLLFGIKNQNILLRLANFPKVPEEKLRQAILLQAQQFIPIPISELVLDCVPGRELIENDR